MFNSLHPYNPTQLTDTIVVLMSPPFDGADHTLTPINKLPDWVHGANTPTSDVAQRAPVSQRRLVYKKYEQDILVGNAHSQSGQNQIILEADDENGGGYYEMTRMVQFSGSVAPAINIDDFVKFYGDVLRVTGSHSYSSIDDDSEHIDIEQTRQQIYPGRTAVYPYQVLDGAMGKTGSKVPTGWYVHIANNKALTLRSPYSNTIYELTVAKQIKEPCGRSWLRDNMQPTTIPAYGIQADVIVEQSFKNGTSLVRGRQLIQGGAFRSVWLTVNDRDLSSFK